LRISSLLLAFSVSGNRYFGGLDAKRAGKAIDHAQKAEAEICASFLHLQSRRSFEGGKKNFCEADCRPHHVSNNGTRLKWIGMTQSALPPFELNDGSSLLISHTLSLPSRHAYAAVDKNKSSKSYLYKQYTLRVIYVIHGGGFIGGL
jgi:hypothetical protein